MPIEDVVITVSHSGYLKRTPLSIYRQQGRGGKGRLGMKTRDEDFVEHLFIASTHSYILVFTNTGKMYWLKVYEIPDVGAAGKGKNIVNLVNLSTEEKVAAVVVVRELPDEPKDVTIEGETYAVEGYVTLVTRLGIIKKTRLAEFSSPNSRGIIAMKIEEGDALIGATLTSGRDTIFLASHEGMAIRFPESDVRDMGRAAYGVYAMDLEKGDYIVGMEIVGEKELILSVTEKGYGKRTAHHRISLAVARRQGRDQREDRGTQWQGGGRAERDRRVGGHAHQPAGQDHPPRCRHHPRNGPLRAGSAAD